MQINPQIRRDILSLIKQRQYQECDDVIGALVAKYEDGKISESDVEYIFLSFSVSDDTLDNLLKEWVEQTGSWNSKLAYAFYLNGVAWEWRGRGFWSTVPDENKNNFKKLVSRSKIIIKSIVKLDRPRDVFPISMLIDLENDSETGDLEEVIAVGLSRFPKSGAIYTSAIRAKTDRWGGNKYDRQRMIHDFDLMSQNEPSLLEWKGYLDYITGYDAFMEKDYFTAIEYYQKAILINPHSVTYRYSLAQAFTKNNQDQEALKEIETVLSVWSTSNNSILLRSKLNFNLGDYNKALVGIEDILTYSPLGKDANMLAARIYGQIGNKKQSTNSLKRASYFIENSATELGRLGCFAHHDLRDLVAAEEYYRKALKEKPNDVGGAYGLATIYSQTESCQIVKALRSYLIGCRDDIGKTKHWCAQRYSNWAHSAVNHLEDHKRCPEINQFDFREL